MCCKHSVCVIEWYSEIFLIFLFWFCEAIGTAATLGLFCQPRVIVKMIVEKQMECRWQGKPKFSEKTCPGRRGGKPATNRLSYGAALF
jgi:hypothetical protein